MRIAFQTLQFSNLLQTLHRKMFWKFISFKCLKKLLQSLLAARTTQVVSMLRWYVTYITVKRGYFAPFYSINVKTNQRDTTNKNTTCNNALVKEWRKAYPALLNFLVPNNISSQSKQSETLSHAIYLRKRKYILQLENTVSFMQK